MASNIFEAIAAIYKEVGYVQKTGKNEAQRYRYAGEADLIAALRPAMAAHNVVFHCCDIKNSISEVIRKETQKGESVTINRCAVYVFRFTHAPSGTSIDVHAQGEGSDSLDKAAYKAATGALKYALRQTFIIETGDDPDDAPVAPPAMATPEQMKQIRELVSMGTEATQKWFESNHGGGIRADGYDKLYNSLNEKIKKHLEETVKKDKGNEQ